MCSRLRSELCQRFLTILVLTSILSPGLAHGWGSVGHRIVARVGSQYAGGFWTANSMGMVKLTTAPDEVWKRLPTANYEKPTHFFQPDGYFDSPSQFYLIPQDFDQAVAKFGASSVQTNGTAVWRGPEFYALALTALKQQDYKTALEYAGIMSHYIGDMSQPLHDSKDYDGQSTGLKGIHAFFETKNIASRDLTATTTAVAKVAKALLNDPKFRNDFKGTLEQVIFNEVGRAYPFKDPLLKIDADSGRKGDGAEQLFSLAVARMGDGAATLTLILDHLWADAGNPTSGATVDVDVPEWVKPQYGQNSISLSSVGFAPADDCED
jgi:hypothetical protein